MTASELRRAMAAGVLFVVLFVAGVVVGFGNAPNIKRHDTAATAASKYVAKLSDSGARTGIVIGAYLLILAAIAFVWFSRGLAQLMPSLGGTRLVGALGVLGAAAVAAGAVTNGAIAGAVGIGGEPVPSGDSARVVMDLAFPFIWLVFALTAAAMLAALAVRSPLLPPWLRYSAWLGVLGGIFGVFFTPLALPLLWLLVVAIVVAVRPVRRPAQAAVVSGPK